MKAVLKNNAARTVLGCDEPSCYANVSKAMGAPFVIRASYAPAGQSQLVSLTVVRAKDVRVAAAASLRVRSRSIDDALDALPKLGAQLFTQLGIRARTEQAMLRLPVAAKKPMPRGFADRPLDQNFSDSVQFLHDSAGNVIAFDPQNPSFLLAGSEEALWLQSVRTSSKRGNERASAQFWDPRGPQPTFVMSDGGYTLTCGKQTITYRPMPPEQAKRTLRAARTFTRRWQRTATLLARDTRGAYYYVDRVRDPEQRTGEVEDYRFFRGRKGRLEHIELEDAIVDRAGAVYLTEAGRLVVEAKDDGKQTVRWFQGEKETALVDVDLWSAAKMVYSRLGAYTGQPLGSACDPYF